MGREVCPDVTTIPELDVRATIPDLDALSEMVATVVERNSRFVSAMYLCVREGWEAGEPLQDKVAALPIPPRLSSSQRRARAAGRRNVTELGGAARARASSAAERGILRWHGCSDDGARHTSVRRG